METEFNRIEDSSKNMTNEEPNEVQAIWNRCMELYLESELLYCIGSAFKRTWNKSWRMNELFCSKNQSIAVVLGSPTEIVRNWSTRDSFCRTRNIINQYETIDFLEVENCNSTHFSTLVFGFGRWILRGEWKNVLSSSYNSPSGDQIKVLLL